MISKLSMNGEGAWAKVKRRDGSRLIAKEPNINSKNKFLTVLEICEPTGRKSAKFKFPNFKFLRVFLNISRTVKASVMRLLPFDLSNHSAYFCILDIALSSKTDFSSFFSQMRQI